MSISIRKRLFWIALATVLLAAFPARNALAAEAIRWQRSFPEAVEEARKNGRILLVHFYGDHCPPCRKMEREVFTRPDVAAAIGRSFIVVKVHTEKNPELTQKLQVKKIPCDVIMTPGGQIVDRREGDIIAERYIEYLNLVAASVPRSALVPTNTESGRPTPVAPSPAMAATPASPVAAQSHPVSPTTSVLPTPVQPGTAPQSSVSRPFAPPVSQPIVPAAPAVAAAPTVSHGMALPAPVAAEAAPKIASSASPPPAIFGISSAPAGSPNASAPPLSALNPPNEIRKKNTGPTAAGPTAPSSAYPVDINAPIATVEIPLGLDGYCPVALKAEERWVSGNPLYFVLFRGRIYRLSTEEALEQFQKEPSRFAPMAGGDDIVLMIDRNKKTPGMRKFGTWYNERLYLFSCAETFDAFSDRPDYYSEIAEKYETALRTHFDKVQR